MYVKFFSKVVCCLLCVLFLVCPVLLIGKSSNLEASAAVSTIDDGYYRIKHVESGKYADVKDVSTENGAILQLWEYAKENQNQIFYLMKTGDGKYVISPNHSYKVIEVCDSRTDDKAPVAQWDYANISCQQWNIQLNSDGTYSFVNSNSGKFLNVEGNRTENGTPFIQYYDDGTTAEKFELIKMGYSDMSGRMTRFNVINAGRIYNTGTLDKNDARYNDKKKTSSYLGYLNLNETELKEKMNSLEAFAELFDDDSIMYLPELFEKFYSGEGGVYSSELLSLFVEANPNTQQYMDKSMEYYEKLLKANKRNGISNDPTSDFIRRNYRVLLGYDYGGKDKKDASNHEDAFGRVNSLYYPASDTGLALAIHDWNSKEIYVANFKDSDNGYSGDLIFVFEDTFGLDEKDISILENLFGSYRGYGLYDGFQAWYLLQHDKNYNGKYKPFTTRVEIKKHFEGSYN